MEEGNSEIALKSISDEGNLVSLAGQRLKVCALGDEALLSVLTAKSEI